MPQENEVKVVEPAKRVVMSDDPPVDRFQEPEKGGVRFSTSVLLFLTLLVALFSAWFISREVRSTQATAEVENFYRLLTQPQLRAEALGMLSDDSRTRYEQYEAEAGPVAWYKVNRFTTKSVLRPNVGGVLTHRNGSVYHEVVQYYPDSPLAFLSSTLLSTAPEN